MRELFIKRLISAVGQLSPDQQRETMHGVLQIARRAKLAASLPASEAEGVLTP